MSSAGSSDSLFCFLCFHTFTFILRVQCISTNCVRDFFLGPVCLSLARISEFFPSKGAGQGCLSHQLGEEGRLPRAVGAKRAC